MEHPVFQPNLKFIDISPEISKDLAVWPGDTPFSQKVISDFKTGNFLLSTMETTLHLGAHADAPNHYDTRGEGIQARSLNYYLGECQVITVKPSGRRRILPSDLKGTPISAQRVLFRTDSFPDPHHWNSDFMSLSAELVDDLAQRGVILVGIDTPSIDLFEDRDLQSHQRVYLNQMAILEGVVLKDAPDGIYFLIALPLKIAGGDASPVRAILVHYPKNLTDLKGFEKRI